MSKTTLFEIIQRDPVIDINVARKYFKCIVLGLEYCHNSALIIHRNIRLENIMIMEETNEAKLIEPGLSFILESEDIEEVIEYNAPELQNESSCKTIQTDIWSLGICLYCMVEKCFPFGGNDPEAIEASILNKNVSFRSITDPDLQDLIKKMLTKNPKERI